MFKNCIEVHKNQTSKNDLTEEERDRDNGEGEEAKDGAHWFLIRLRF
jgi:hypothetical protein